MVTRADKVAVKAYVADVLGAEWVTPTIWHGTTLPDQPSWKHPFVVKSRHGSNQTIFVRDKNFDWADLRARCQMGAASLWPMAGRMALEPNSARHIG